MSNDKPLAPSPTREGIAGFKLSDYVTAEKVLGGEIRIEELPEGIKFFIKGQQVDLGTKQIEVNLYELVDDEGVKLKRMHLEKFRNRIPEEEEIALKYGPNKGGYIWIAKWRKNATSEDTGVMSDTIRISEKWLSRHQAYQKQLALDAKRQSEEANPPAPVALASAPVVASFGPLEMMRFMQEGEDRAIRNMERMAIMFKTDHSAIPSAVMERAYESAGSIMQKAMESNLEMGRKVGKMVQREMDPPEPEEEQEVVQESQGVLPAWLQPFLPQIENWIGTLLGGGPMGAAVKTLILSSEQWKEIFNDKEKFGVAVQAMREHFGDDKAQKAIDMLMGVKKPNNQKKAGK
jgi:hypothetical protein